MAARVKKELAECQKDVEISGVSAVEKSSGNLEELVGTIIGPDGTPYANGHFQLDISIPQRYPFEPPIMKFRTKIWHPNISSQTGAICLDILKDAWSPALTIKTALLSIQALLSAAEPDDPQDAEVAKMYRSDYDTFTNTARFWTESYAQPPTVGSADSTALLELIEMGFEKEASQQALAKHNGDKNAAIEEIISSM